MKATTVVITSNNEPGEWYKNISNFDAFLRRVDMFMYFGEDGIKLETESYDSFLSAYKRNKVFA